MGEASLWEVLSGLLGVLMAWSAIFLWAIKWMLAGNQKHVDQRFKVLEDSLLTQEKQWQNSDRELLKFKADMPKEYVRREDWIRFGATIDKKLDGLGKKIDVLQEKTV